MTNILRINFVGDISLNDAYRNMYKKGLKPFKALEPMFLNCDLVIGNLECLIQGSEGENTLKIPRLKTDINTINFLKDINLSVACLANNHAYDNLEDGFKKTTTYLESIGIEHLGASITGHEYVPYIYTKNNIKIGILNYVTDDTNPCIPPNVRLKLNIFKIESASNDIKILKDQVDQIVVFIHWGGKMEGAMYPDIYQPKVAHKIIDFGADLIIGHHSHTLQPYEIYNGKYIFYSLGNFCFADVFFEGKRIELDKKRTNPSIILSVDFSKSNYAIQMYGIKNNYNIIEPDNTIVPNKIKQLTYNKTLLYKFPFWEIYFLYEKKIYPTQAYFFSNNRNPFNQILKLKLKSILKHLIRFFKSS